LTRAGKYRALRWLRRVSQGAFLLLFMVLLLKTSIDTIASPDVLPTIGAPVALFLEMDPLLALLTVLTTQELYRNMIWALAILLGTVFIGRLFCGWICPLGTLNQMLSSIRYGRTKGKRLLDANRYRPYQRWKYAGLAVFLGAGVFGSLQVGIMDPIALLTRSLSMAFVPAWNVSMAALAGSGGAGESGMLDRFVDAAGAFFSHLVTRPRPVFYHSAFAIGLIFIAVLASNRFITRFWCRGLCPLGALLGLFSRFAIFGMQKKPSLCTDCNKCALHCQGGDDPQPGYTWRQSECHLCFNCVADCPEAGIDFRLFPNRSETRQSVDIRRRTVIASTAAGLAAVPLLRAETGLQKGADPSMVRPPGAVGEEDFLARCVRCGECMNVCPNNALHPTFLQAGLEGVWSPMLEPRIGYCEPTCVLCGTVCPTGAIDEITSQEKGWVPHPGVQETGSPPIRIGTAFYDFGRCLPWAMATECIVCEEWCPTTPKAIYFEEAEARDRKGGFKLLKRPHIDPQIFIGCGACTFACPVKGAPAVYVTSAGETRNPRNSMLLKTPGVEKNHRSSGDHYSTPNH